MKQGKGFLSWFLNVIAFAIGIAICDIATANGVSALWCVTFFAIGVLTGMAIREPKEST